MKISTALTSGNGREESHTDRKPYRGKLNFSIQSDSRNVLLLEVISGREYLQIAVIAELRRVAPRHCDIEMNYSNF